jgi:hypothetical protein
VLSLFKVSSRKRLYLGKEKVKILAHFDHLKEVSKKRDVCSASAPEFRPLIHWTQTNFLKRSRLFQSLRSWPLLLTFPFGYNHVCAGFL